jgi:hypothetical protein
MTEDAFAALAAENSADGNAAQGGLYEDVSRGMMVEPFDAWCFDPQRNNGDTGIVETDFGYHVMYFSNQKGIAWQVEVDKALRDAAFTEHLTQAKEERPMKRVASECAWSADPAGPDQKNKNGQTGHSWPFFMVRPLDRPAD